MVASLERLIQAGEIAVRAAQVAKALRGNGSNEAASVLERECTEQCKKITGTIRRRRQAANRARRQNRIGGRFA